jgi:hypothetical protein
MKQPAVARSRRASPVLVCKKCLKRNSEGGRLRRELEREIKRRGNGVQKAPRLVPTNCFGLCPKNAVVLASGSSLEKGEYVLASRPKQARAALSLLRSVD